MKLETPQMIESLKALSLRASQRTSLQTTSLKATSLKATSLQTTSLTRRKRVSFADEYGLELLMVREFTESSNSPPMIRRGLLSAITTGASASVTERPPLVLQFSQPASDYYQFRERLERLSVSLENVILKDYNIMGTVKVKNIAFEKKVKVRFTYDSWESFTDVYASYVSNRQTNAHSPYDTFAFEIQVPPNFDVKKSIEFVVCYDAGTTEYWDNNNDNNYIVSSTDWNLSPEPEEHTDSPVFRLDTTVQSQNWTEFSSWTNNDSAVPYW